MIRFTPGWMSVAIGELAKGVKEDKRSRFFSANASERHRVTHMALQMDQAVGHGLAQSGIEVKADGWIAHASNPEVEKYFTAVKVWGGRDITGKTDGGNLIENPSDEVPWCAAFVNWCLEQSGVTGNGSTSAKSFQKYGVGLHTPLYGCIAAVRRAPGSNKHHVGFFLRREGSRVILLGGNQSDKVSDTGSYPYSGAYFRWPEGVERRPTQDVPDRGGMLA